MDMRSHVAEASKIDFVGIKQLAQNRFNRKNNVHQLIPFVFWQIAHFPDMPPKNNAAEAGILCIGDPYNATKRTLPDQLTADRGT